MIRRPRLTRHAATTVAVLGLASTAPAHQTPAPGNARTVVQGLWYQAYDQGVRAANAGNWALAIPALESAKRGGPAPGRRVLFQGDRVDVFNPDYYLGLAYNATRRYAEAEAAFARVAEAGLVRQGDRDFDELRRQQTRATYERAVLDGERALDAGRLAEAEQALLPVVDTLGADDRAGKLIARVRRASVAANVTKQEPAPAVPTPPPDYTPPVATNTATPPLTGNVRPGTSEPSKAPGTLAGGIGNTSTGPYLPPNAGVNPKLPPPVVPDETQATIEGLTAYHAGNYARAAAVLQPAFAIDPPSARVAFYLACSVVARAILAGGLDQATTDEARRMFVYAQGDGPQFAADRAVISPVVLRALGSTAPATSARKATAS